jgi:excisionase family DNA binding protein
VQKSFKVAMVVVHGELHTLRLEVHMKTTSPTLTNGERLLTMNEAVTILGVSRNSVYRLIDDGKLEAVKVRNRTFFRNSDLTNYINDLEPVRANKVQNEPVCVSKSPSNPFETIDTDPNWVNENDDWEPFGPNFFISRPRPRNQKP